MFFYVFGNSTIKNMMGEKSSPEQNYSFYSWIVIDTTVS